MKRAWGYTVVYYDEYSGEEKVCHGVVFAKSMAKATKKLHKAYHYEDPNKKYSTCVDSITVEDYCDEGGEPTDIYETYKTVKRGD